MIATAVGGHPAEGSTKHRVSKLHLRQRGTGVGAVAQGGYTVKVIRLVYSSHPPVLFQGLECQPVTGTTVNSGTYWD